MRKFKEGDKLKIKDECKKELISFYNTSGGMSGVSKKDTEKNYIFKGMNGSNIIVSYLNGKRILSLHHSRFEKAFYTPQEVKDKFKELIKNSNFIDFAPSFGINGWDMLDTYLEDNI